MRIYKSLVEVVAIILIVFPSQPILPSHPQIRLTDTLGKLSRILETDHFALVVHEQIQCKYSMGLTNTLTRSVLAYFYFK